MPGLSSDFAWSFSKLVSYLECPRGFYLRYVDRDEDDVVMENAYGQYGTLGHKLIEEWAKGELKPEDMAKEWDERYALVVTASFPPFPKGYPLAAYKAGLAYFERFAGFGDIDILEVEEKFSTKIGAYTFHGIADLVYRDRPTGALTIMDHKSKSESSMKKDYDLYKRQLYLYAKHVLEKFGELPSMLKFNMFKAGYEIEIPFRRDEYDESLAWAEEIIDDANMETEWAAKPTSFRCQWICDMRYDCPYSERSFT